MGTVQAGMQEGMGVPAGMQGGCRMRWGVQAGMGVQAGDAKRLREGDTGRGYRQGDEEYNEGVHDRDLGEYGRG